MLGIMCIVVACRSIALTFRNDRRRKDIVYLPKRLKDEIWREVSQMNPSDADLRVFYEKYDLQSRGYKPETCKKIAVNLWRENVAGEMLFEAYRRHDLYVG